MFNDLYDDDTDFNKTGSDDMDLTPSTVSDESSFSFQDDLRPSPPDEPGNSPHLLPPPESPFTSHHQQAVLEHTPLNTGYWTNYSLPQILPPYDPYLTSSSHYEYQPHHLYYNQEPASSSNTVIDPVEMNHANTTEDITFAEAFTALANFEPNSELGSSSAGVSDPGAAGSRKTNGIVHLETFNEISSG